MTPKDAWAIIQDQIRDDCGPWDEGWKSEELMEAVEVFHRLYSPEMTLKALFPESPYIWAPSDRQEQAEEARACRVPHQPKRD